MSKIVFCDVDGPLIPGRMYYAKHAYYSDEFSAWLYDPVAVGMIRELCKKFEAQVVFNTAHNHENLDVMRNKARINGFEDLLHPDCRTNFCITEERRIDAINEWLSRHKDVDKWIVIDDEANIHPTNQVTVNFGVGLTIDNFYEACEKFGGKRPGLII